MSVQTSPVEAEVKVEPEVQSVGLKSATSVPPGGREQVSGLDTGTHKFQCCFHPWMRAVVEVN